MNPETWFPEIPQGRPNIAIVKNLAKQVKFALEICDTCPAKWKCEEEGMKPENLPYGIWGGKLAGERLVEAGYQLQDFTENTEEWRAINLAVRLTPWVRWE